MDWRARIRGFFLNDLRHAPFGIGILRGVTPGRFAAFFLLCLAPELVVLDPFIMARGIVWEIFPFFYRRYMETVHAAIPLFLFLVWADRGTERSRTWVRVSAFVVAVLAGAVGYALGNSWRPVLIYGVPWRDYPLPEMMPIWFYKAATGGGIAAAVLFMMSRERETQRRLQQTRVAQVAIEREIVEARLQLLNAQIEPHFLFNSLASVKRLYEQGRGGGRELLRNLGDYLASAVDRGRRRECTLGEEVDMARSFLEIFATRMGERLRLKIDVPQHLRRALVPPLMLGTLVENAVKHGIGPRGSGGTVGITARSIEGRLVLAVTDDGVGFHGESGTGVGLANTRARLQSLHGAEGSLDLARNASGGVTATILMPLRLEENMPVAASAPAAARDGGAQPRAGASGFLGRFAEIITWRHWAWAAGLGTAAAALDRVRASVRSYLLGDVWLFETYYDMTCACFFMLAIVAVEAARRGAKPPRGWHYATGAVAASVLSLALVAVFPMPPYEPVTAREVASSQAARKAGRLNKIPEQVRQSRRVYAQMSAYGMLAVIHGLLGTTIYVWFGNTRRAAAALAQAEIDRSEASRRLLESRVEAVQAEVDPGFLFKTLDAVGEAYEVDHDAADAMLDELIAMLRSAIPNIRTEETTSAAVS